jgi:uncharacterized membrane protein
MVSVPSTTARGYLYHRLFQIGIWVKGIDGLLEVIGGILFFMVSPAALNRYVAMLTQDELREDPDDLLANMLRHAASHLSVNSKLIGSAYLLGNGVVKIFLAAGILRGKLWCYPAAIVVISLFVCLQIARLFFHFSILMLIGTVIDIAIVLLIGREYRRVKPNAF